MSQITKSNNEDIAFKNAQVKDSKSVSISSLQENRITESFREDKGRETVVKPADQKKEIEISDFGVTADGILGEHWNTIDTYQARILEVSENFIILECVTNIEEKVFENRKFDIAFLKNIVPFKLYHPVLIKVFKRPGEMKFKIIDGTDLFDEKIFENTYFNDLDIQKLTKKFV